MIRRWTVPALLLVALVPVALPVRSEGETADPLPEARRLREAGEYGTSAAVLRLLLESRPDDPVVLHELGLTAERHAKEILSGSSPALGRLALQDAMNWFRRAIAAKPDWAEPLKGLGRTAILSGDHPLASASYGKAAALDEADGESRYQLGYALAFERRFREAVVAFETAERILGPQPRILLNLGISHASRPDVPRAEACLRRLLDNELAAGRKGSFHCSRGVLWLWRIFAREKRFDRAEDVFTALSDKYPEFSGAFWYLGHARWSAGRPRAAVAPFRRVVELTPAFAEGHRLLTQALIRSGKFDAAATALKAYAALGAGGQSPLAVLIELADAMASKKKYAMGIDLLASFEETFPDDPDLVERRADLMFLEGRLLDALGEYRRAAALNPFSDAPAVKAQKAVTALLRRNEAPSGGEGLRPEPSTGEPSAGGGLYDFEGSSVFARMNGPVTGAYEDGVFRIERTEDPGRPANLALTMMPTLDTRRFDSIRCTVRGIKGETFRLMAKDGFDEFGIRMVRIRHRDVVTFTGMPRQVVSFPLDGFVAFGRPELPFNRARLRSLIFEIGLPGGEEERPSSEIQVEDVTLVAADGTEVLLADLEGPLDETLFLSGGAASAFARTLFTAEQAADFRADPNTFVRPAILGGEFDPAFVRAGLGAFRLSLPAARPGPAWGELTLARERAGAAAGAVAIFFWARGLVGGEKLRVTLIDALDVALRIERPASAPRLEVGPTMVEGRYTLTKEWRRYRITRAAFPDIDFGTLRKMRFDFGPSEGNAGGTVLFLDDIRWE